jgi:hypothetical protein
LQALSRIGRQAIILGIGDHREQALEPKAANRRYNAKFR